MSGKGKGKVADSGDKGKRKWSDGDDKTGGGKRKNRGVLQFFDDAAYQDDEGDFSSDDSMFDNDFEDEFDADHISKNDRGKFPSSPVVPKEEEMSEEEIERILEGGDKLRAGFVTNAEDGYEHKKITVSNVYAPSAKDPAIWKVKCVVGRERYSAFCLMQKYVDMEILGKKLSIISAFAPDHVKGFIFIEADKQNDIYEACKGLCTIYPSRVTPIPSNEFSRLLSVRNKSSGISKDMWARVKNGKYKGDLAFVVAVNEAQKKVTVKLIPRIDLKTMAEKFGGGVAAKRTAIPPQRLIRSSELDEFRPLIHCRRDRDTNEAVEVLDGVMLKDGYVYKKVSIDSLSFWGVIPTADELLKFEPSQKDESTDVQWLSQLFGEKKKEQVEIVKQVQVHVQDKGSGNSEGSTSASMGINFEVNDLVFFGRKDFGVVIGSEKDDSVKVIREGSDGPSVVTLKQSDLKRACFDKKLFHVLDRNSNTISINDIVRVLDGPLKDREGIVKKIYRGILFLRNENEHENNGYICIKAKLGEKVNLSGKESHEKGSEPGPSVFGDFSLSPKSPSSPDKSCQERDNKTSFQREDDGIFSIGQSLRIRVGPLKGYLCRVLATRRSDVTVKLDSQQKILTVKSEHLSEVRGRNSAVSQGEEPGSIKPFDFIGTQEGAIDWMNGAALSTEGNKWNTGGSTDRTSWSTFDSSNSWLSKEPGSANPIDDHAKKGTEDSSWQIKGSNESSSWGVAVIAAKQDTVPDTGLGGWGTISGSNKATSSKAATGGSDSWGKAAETHLSNSGDSLQDNSWGGAADKWSSGGDASGSKSAWGQSGAPSEKQTGGWNAGDDLDLPKASSWKKDSAAVNETQWGKSGDVTKDGNREGWGKGESSLGKHSSPEDEDEDPMKSWDTKKSIEDAPEYNQNERWNKPSPVGAGSGSSWDKNNDKSSWGKSEGASSIYKQDAGSSLNKPAEKSWGQQSDVNKGSGSSWDKKNDKSWGNTEGTSSGDKQDAGSSWNKTAEISWGQQSDVKKGSGEKTDEWRSAKTDGNNTSSGWNISKGTNSNMSSGWSGASTGKEETGNGGGSWDKVTKPNDSSKSSWNAGTTSSDVNQSSDWGSKGSWGSAPDGKSSGCNDDGKAGKGGSWKDEKNADGGSSGGWGRNSWGKSGTSGALGNQESGWSSKSNWSSGGDFVESNNQDNSSGDGGRGGHWRGGRDGGGGFRGGRGRSDFGGSGNQESTWSSKSSWNLGGGFGDSESRDDSSNDRGRGGRWDGGRGDHGGYRGGRWGSEGGRFGGRGESDREGGFRGRGGFRGKGRGDWNNRGGDSNGDKPYSWKTGSDQNSEGWKSSSGGGSWKQTDNENNKPQSWGGSSWNSSSEEGGWKQGGGDNKLNQNEGSSCGDQAKGDASNAWNAKDGGRTDTVGSVWGSSNSSAREATGGWNKQSPKKATGGWNNAEIGQSNDPDKTGWNKQSPKNATGGWNNAGIGQSNDFNKSPSSTQGTARGGNSPGNWERSVKNEGPSGSWGKDGAVTSWGGGSGKW